MHILNVDKQYLFHFEYDDKTFVFLKKRTCVIDIAEGFGCLPTMDMQKVEKKNKLQKSRMETY